MEDDHIKKREPTKEHQVGTAFFARAPEREGYGEKERHRNHHVTPRNTPKGGEMHGAEKTVEAAKLDRSVYVCMYLHMNMYVYVFVRVFFYMFMCICKKFMYIRGCSFK